MDVQIVIRSNGERTLDLCKKLAVHQSTEQNVIVIAEKPFSRAVQKTFEIGIEKNKKWTLALDADILLRSNSLKSLIDTAETLPDSFFLIQGRVLDKLFGFARNGGPHLFRTKYCQQALEIANTTESELRPESKVIKEMASKGYHSYGGVENYGLHDFFQYDSDIFRTAYNHGIKFKHLHRYFLNEWALRMHSDSQYTLATLAYSLSFISEDEPSINKDSQKIFFELGLHDQKKDSITKIDPRDIDKHISEFKISAEAVYRQKLGHNEIVRSDRKRNVKESYKSLRSRILKKIEHWAIRNR